MRAAIALALLAVALGCGGGQRVGAKWPGQCYLAGRWALGNDPRLQDVRIVAAEAGGFYEIIYTDTGVENGIVEATADGFRVTDPDTAAAFPDSGPRGAATLPTGSEAIRFAPYTCRPADDCRLLHCEFDDPMVGPSFVMRRK